MNRSTFLPALAIAAMALAPAGYARRHAPYDAPRIFWDIKSKQTLFTSGSYARIIELQDGRLMAVGESGGGISINWSEDGGKSWGNAYCIVPNEDRLPFAVPDAIQLSNGDIVVGYNPRPSTPYSPDRKFGIRCVRSTDGGKTWGPQIIIYNASHEGGEGCWEPCFLELPSGELQCYFANEYHFPASGEQEISMCRSFDGGQTWSSDSRVSFSAGSRDGMPVPFLSENGEIVVIIEDNGWPGYGGFRATTVRSSLASNWSSSVDRGSSKRQMIFANEADKAYNSAAPYIRKLGTDATIASWQGDRPPRQGLGEACYDMYVGVGDADGRNVKAITAPFGLPTDQHGLWNSVTVLGDEKTVFAVSSVGTWTSGQALCSMTGYALKDFQANFGTPTLDGALNGEDWTSAGARQIYLGALSSRYQSTVDFLYDNECLYVYADIEDHSLRDDDGITLALDPANACDQYPQEGMYRIFFRADGTATMQEGKGNRWVDADAPEEVDIAISKKRNQYTLEAAIPWHVLGCEKAPSDTPVRCYLEVADARADGNVISETIPETDVNASWTWPVLKFQPHEDGEEVDDTAVPFTQDVLTPTPVKYYDLTGVPVGNPLPGHLYIRKAGSVSDKVIYRQTDSK